MYQKIFLKITAVVFTLIYGNHMQNIFRVTTKIFSASYDRTSECLAVRILNIKNIPRNNKDVSSNLTLSSQGLTLLSLQFGIVYKTYISICLVPDERSERRAYQSSNTFRFHHRIKCIKLLKCFYFSDHNPIFNECFFFQVSPQDMVDRILKVSKRNLMHVVHLV